MGSPSAFRWYANHDRTSRQVGRSAVAVGCKLGATSPTLVSGRCEGYNKPRPKRGELSPEINDIIVEHNRLAATVMMEMRVPVINFYGLLVSKLDLAREDQFHWKPEAYKILADQVATSILQALPR